MRRIFVIASLLLLCSLVSHSQDSTRMNKVLIGMHGGYNGAAKSPAISWHGAYLRNLHRFAGVAVELGYVQSWLDSDGAEVIGLDTVIAGRRLGNGYFKAGLMPVFKVTSDNFKHQFNAGIGPVMAFGSITRVVRQEDGENFPEETISPGGDSDIRAGIGGLTGYTFTTSRNYIISAFVMWDLYFGKERTHGNILPGIMIGRSF